MPLPTKQKVFCIGFNKTGTTSIGAALQSMGYTLGNQGEAELLIDDWARRDFRRLLKLCETADAFQDIPFSLPETYAALDEAFAGSKFVLTVRNNSQEWFESLTRFHTKLIAKGRLPTATDLQACTYREPGWLWNAHRLIFGADESTVYDRSQ
ncbi:MAG TPA: sulfotransferase, partial [Lacipirellulaceae bacterium]|nr:sulfotransferase [Lacipirellulaceae bacterium]